MVEAASATKSTLAPLRIATRLVTMSLGVNAEMTPDERADIADPLTRIYQRNPRVAAYVNRYTDPFMLASAIGVYVLRIWLAFQQTQLARAQTALALARQGQPQRPAPVPIRPEPAPVAPVPDRAIPAKQDGPSFAELDNLMGMGQP